MPVAAGSSPARQSSEVAAYPPEPELKTVALTGVLTFRRRLSKKLVFYDLDAGPAGAVELVVKVGRLSLEQVSELRLSLHLGDRVDVEGWLEEGGASAGNSSVAVRSIVVREKWSEAQPGKHFVPRKITKAPNRPASPGGDSATAEGGVCNGAGAGGGVGTAAGGGVCKYFINTGSCPRGRECEFWHGSEPGTESPAQKAAVAAARASWVVRRKQSRREIAREAGDPHADTAASKSHRATVFVDWLVEQFGMELLQGGTGVLDVGGGRGEVAFELCARGVPVTLVDPRQQQGLSKKQRRLLADREGVAEGGVSGLEGGGAPAGWLCKQVQDEFSPALWESEEHGPHLQGCSLVVGMHPDQATDGIVEFATRLHKPFAVVPCCVFGRLFPERRVKTASGEVEKVERVDQLVQHLLQKAQGSSTTYLPFGGRNQVVFRAAGGG